MRFGISPDINDGDFLNRSHASREEESIMRGRDAVQLFGCNHSKIQSCNVGDGVERQGSLDELRSRTVHGEVDLGNWKVVSGKDPELQILWHIQR